LTEAIAALDVTLAAVDIADLEQPYVPGPLRTDGYKQVMAQQAKRAAADN
jgi:hypothetical protein